MKRRLARAILKATLCALLLPGCSALRFFQKSQPASADASTAQSAQSDRTESGRYQPSAPTPEQIIPQASESPIEPVAPVLSVMREAVNPGPALPKTVTPKTDDPLLLAFKSILDGRPNDALQYLGSFDESTQDLLLRLLPMLATLKDKGLEQMSPQQIGVLHEQVESLLTALRPRTDLVIEKLCCCESVKGFGDYVPLPEGHVSRPGEVIWLYVELRNFCAEPQGPVYELHLGSSVKIHDPRKPEDQAVWQCKLTDATKPQRVRRSMPTYFQDHRFVLPAHLAPGVYTLTLTVTDESQPERRRVAEKSMEFRVTNAQGLAATR